MKCQELRREEGVSGTVFILPDAAIGLLMAENRNRPPAACGFSHGRGRRNQA